MPSIGDFKNEGGVSSQDEFLLNCEGIEVAFDRLGIKVSIEEIVRCALVLEGGAVFEVCGKRLFIGNTENVFNGRVGKEG